MQKSGSKPQSVRHRVKSSAAKNRKSMQRPDMAAKQASSMNTQRRASMSMDMKRPVSMKQPKKTVQSPRIIISENRTMASNPKMKKQRVSIIERDSEPEIIIASPKMVEKEPEDVQLLSDSGSELVPASVSKLSAKQLKERAIAKALSEAARPTEKKVIERPMRTHFNWTRVMLAFACAAAAVFAIVYFVNLNSPDISFKVAAMQTGIDASYPSYVPRDYSLSDITSENGKITLNFKNSSTNETFSLIEEKSAWDSNTLMANYVRVEYGDSYTMIREQGLTIFISDSDAAWVNGGVVYKLKATPGLLTKKQIKAIAVSL